MSKVCSADAIVINSDALLNHLPGQTLLSGHHLHLEMISNEETLPSSKSESDSFGIPNFPVEFTILYESVWVETFWFRVVFRVVCHGPV